MLDTGDSGWNNNRQQTQRTFLDWLRVENSIETPSNKLLAVTDLDSDPKVGKVKRVRGKKLPLTALRFLLSGAVRPKP